MARKQSGPQFVQYFPLILDALRALGGSGRPEEVINYISDNRSLDESEQETLADGQTRFEKNVHWGRFYLAKTNYIDSSVRGVWTLTDKGNSAFLNNKSALEIFNTVHSQYRRNGAKSEEDAIEEDVVEELESHRSKLLETMRHISPEGFERLCQRLLRESGFQEVTVRGRSGDGGIDGLGLLRVHPLVSLRVFFQCKRYQGTVGSSIVRDFRGAIVGRADKGIILTTGAFSAEAKSEAKRDGTVPIELVDGNQLVEMMESLQLGLRVKEVITVYEVDDDFFKDYR